LSCDYFLLKEIASYIDKNAKGLILEECIGLNKKEILFEFKTPLSFGEGQGVRFNIQLYLGEEAFIFFPHEVKFSSKQKINILQNLYGKKLISAAVFENDRSIKLDFESKFTLVFKMYGRNANVLLFQNEEVIWLFKPGFESDKIKKLSDFENTEKPFNKRLETPPNNPVYYIFKTGPKNINDPGLAITFLNSVLTPLFTSVNLDEALNFYADSYISNKHFLERKNSRISALLEQKKKEDKRLRSLNRHLYELENDKDYKMQADLLMAYMYQIPAKAESIRLRSFYDDKEIEIAIKKGFSPQKWAEKLYQKAKNQGKEKDKVLENLSGVEKELQSIEEEIKVLEAITEPKGLRAFIKEEKKESPAPELPFRKFEFHGYIILVGKSAENNDVLTFKYAHKNDLWLHARGVSGSHVVVKHKGNTDTFPKEVIEKAAQIAAYYSKGKTSGLCPVIYTLKKYVRKPKGAHPGAVVCEREEVMMVEPGNKS